MQTRKQTAWKKNRKLGDVYGGRTFPKLADRIFSRRHSLTPPVEGEEKPVYMVDNPSRDFYFPITVEEIKAVLEKLPKKHTEHLTHIWLQKIKKDDYESGQTVQGCFICGSKVYLIVLHPFPVDHKMRLGRLKPVKRIMNFYRQYCTDLQQDQNGWYLQWDHSSIRRYYLEHLLLHEVGHAVDSFYKRYWSKTAGKQKEDFADQYAAVWANTIREEIEKLDKRKNGHLH